MVHHVRIRGKQNEKFNLSPKLVQSHCIDDGKKGQKKGQAIRPCTSAVLGMPMNWNRSDMAMGVSSAAKMPLPGWQMALTVASSSDLVDKVKCRGKAMAVVVETDFDVAHTTVCVGKASHKLKPQGRGEAVCKGKPLHWPWEEKKLEIKSCCWHLPRPEDPIMIVKTLVQAWVTV